MILLAFKNVFGNIRYTFIAVVVSLATFVFAIWLPNWRLIMAVIKSETMTLAEKIKIPFSLLGSIGTNFTFISASYVILIAVLFGINSAMIIYLISRRVAVIKQSGLITSVGGVFSGILGIGCATCGSVILVPLLSFMGASGVLVLLPLGGQEFGILGIIMMVISIFLVARKIQNPLICNINK